MGEPAFQDLYPINLAQNTYVHLPQSFISDPHPHLQHTDDIEKALPPPPNSNGKSNPNSLSYLLSPAISPDDGIRLLLRSYVPIVEKARYARGEPSEEEAAAVESAVDLILLT
jgi:hypothetical protein